MAKLILPDGQEREVKPRNKRKGFTLEELYALLECDTVERWPAERIGSPGLKYDWAFFDEHGRLRPDQKPNRRAWFIFGNILLVHNGEVR